MYRIDICRSGRILPLPLGTFYDVSKECARNVYHIHTHAWGNFGGRYRHQMSLLRHDVLRDADCAHPPIYPLTNIYKCI